MEALFLEVVNRSLATGVLILIVIVLRACFIKMPKWVRLVLWGFVAVRLVCPVMLESKFSLMPDTDNVIEFLGEASEQRAPEFTEQMQISDSGSVESEGSKITDTPWQENKEAMGAKDTLNRNPMEDPATEPSKEERPEDDRQVSDFDIQPEKPQVSETTVQEQPLQNKTGQLSVLSVAVILWLVGMVCLCLYSTVKYLRLKQQVRVSINERENIYLCDTIDTPFVLGFVSPKIYLPSGLEQETADYAVLHEKEHLRCGDQWWKLLSFLLLVLYWFHPLVWVAYLLACNDIEYACDERVIKRLEREERKAYTKALLSCSMGHRTMLFCPPSFVRNSVRERVRSVVNFKKATIPVLCLAVVVCVTVAVTFLTDRKQGGAYEIELNSVELSEKMAEAIAEEIAELMQDSAKGISGLENFSFTFYELESEQENRMLRVSVEADSTLVREPEESPLIQGMKKAQSELTYEAERTFARTMIDSMLAQMEADREERICEPAIFVTLDEKGDYELAYGDAERTPLEDYFQKENAEQEEILGYLTVYQRAGIQPPMDTVGSSGYVYSKALENPENQVVNYAAYVSGISVNQSFLYYGDSVYDDIAAYEVKDKEKLPWALLGDEIKLAYSNNGRYWSERDKLAECTGHGTIYQVKGYEDSYLVALVYARDFPAGMYGMSSWESIPYKQRVFHRDDVLEDGVNPTYCVILCERMNDLWFHEGREVFSKRLHLENAVATNGLSMGEELVWNFLAELNDATFIQPDSTGLPELSELASQTITFTDAVGVKHSMILYEGGYVVKQVCNTRLIAKIEEETCRRVMERIQAYEAEQPVVSFERAFPVDKVWNREEGYEEIYEEFSERVRGQLFNENFLPFWGDEDGYYVSRVPLYEYDVQHDVLSNGTSLLVLSKEFDRSGLFWFHLSFEEPGVAYRSWPQEILELMKEQPSEEFIFLDMAPGLAMLDDRNVIRWNSSQSKQNFTPEDGLYQKLYSDELAVSYEELTAKENLLWVSVKGDEVPEASDVPTPSKAPVDKSQRLYQKGYEKSSYAAYSATEWLKNGRLEVPFDRNDMLEAGQMSERYAMYYIPQEALRKASTVDLVRVSVFDYPFGTYSEFEFPSEYLNSVRECFNAVDELFGREDMATALLKMYEANGFSMHSAATSKAKKEEAARRENGIVLMEILLATDEVFERIDGCQSQVLDAVKYKMQMRNSGLYLAEKSVDGFFSYIKENSRKGNKWYDYIMTWYSDDKELLMYLENASYPTDSVKVQSQPLEETVTSTKPPVSAEDEALKTIKLPLMGEECTFEVLGKKRADMDIYGVREIILYTGGEPYQSILVQEAIDADGVDGIDKGYTECPNMEDTVNLKDVNFDGYPDLEVWGWSPNNSIPYYYWCWNPETLQFEYAFCLQLTDVDEERKHLISYTKAGGGVYYMERYRVTRENKLELAERMTEDYRTFMNWQEAYRDVIYNFPDNMMDLNNPYATRDTSDWTNAEKYMYLGILDFDADGTPELLIGDTVSLAVFTFRNGRVEKCTEVILPNGFNKIDDVGFKENAVIVNCYGASAFGYAAVTYRDGKWINATCSNEDGEIFINGEKATSEAWNTVMPFPVDEWGNIEKLGRIPREYRNRVVKEEDGSYVLYTWTKEEGTWYYEYGWTETGVALDATFDFEQLRWTED